MQRSVLQLKQDTNLWEVTRDLPSDAILFPCSAVWSVPWSISVRLSVILYQLGNCQRRYNAMKGAQQKIFINDAGIIVY